MPIYEFRCQDCDTVFARLLSISDEPRVVGCPSCGSSATERVPSTFAAGASTSATQADACPSAPACGAAAGGG